MWPDRAFRPITCTGTFHPDTLAPGESFDLPYVGGPVPVYELVGDGLGGDWPLEPGRYWLAFAVPFNDDGPSEVEVPAGSVTLSNSVDAVPSARVARGLRYEAKSEVFAGGDSLALDVSITNLRSDSVDVVGWPDPDCSATLRGYSSALARDTWYRNRPWPYTAWESCPLRILHERMGPGHERRLRSVLPLPARGRGTYLLLSLSVSPGSDSGQHILLSAGLAEEER